MLYSKLLMGVISIANGWSIDGHQAAGRQEEAMLEAVVRDGVAEALLVATTSETRKRVDVGSNTLCAHWLGRLRQTTSSSAEEMDGQGWLRSGCHMFSHGAQFIWFGFVWIGDRPFLSRLFLSLNHNVQVQNPRRLSFSSLPYSLSSHYLTLSAMNVDSNQ